MKYRKLRIECVILLITVSCFSCNELNLTGKVISRGMVALHTFPTLKLDDCPIMKNVLQYGQILVPNSELSGLIVARRYL